MLKTSAALWLARFGWAFPPKLQLTITYACNSRCKRCNIWKIYQEHPEKIKEELSLEHYEVLFKDYGKDLKWLSITGGEPTLHRHLVDIVALAKQYGDLEIVSFPTNGLLPSILEERVRQMLALGVSPHVSVSLDGLGEVYERVRGIRGGDKKAIESFERLRELGVDVHFEFTVHPENAEHVKEFLTTFEYARHVKVFTFTHTSSSFYSNESNPVKQEELRKIRQALEFIYKWYKVDGWQWWVEKFHLKLALKFLDKGQVMPCAVGRGVITIDPYGNVAPCWFLPSAGNVKEQRLRNIVRSSRWQQLSQRAARLQCPRCWINCFSMPSMAMYPERLLWALIT
jgi:MoaA/NifB/PqqE/SkfB family radical SAM enzyme